MRYPVISLRDVESRYFNADYTQKPETGSFLEINLNQNGVRIRVDRFSTIPFYYTVFEGKLFGATKISRLLRDLPDHYSRKLDRVAALQFIRTNSMLGDRTLLEGIRQIPYGSELVWDKYTVKICRYWVPSGEVDHSMTSISALEQLYESFEKSVIESCRDSDRIGIHLSGGMDSRQMLGAMLRLGKHFKAFTYGLNQSLDVLVANQLAKTLHVDHIVDYWPKESRFLIDAELHFALTDGMQALFHGHGVHLHEQQSKMVDRMLHGHFLDLYMQGHMYNQVFDKGVNRSVIRGRLYETFDGGPCSVMRGDSIEDEMVTKDLRGAFRESVMQYVDEFSYMEPEKQYDSVYFFHHGLRRLQQQIQSGAQFLDYRTPGLHSDYFEVAWRIPASLRKERKLQSQMLRVYYPKTVSTVPLVKNNTGIIYGGQNQYRAALCDVTEKLRRRGYLPMRYDYYGLGIRNIVRSYLWPELKKEILSPALIDAAVVQPDYLHCLVDAVELDLQIPTNQIGSLYSLSRFITCVINKGYK